MLAGRFISDVTAESGQVFHWSPAELEQFAKADLSFSDTETTGLRRDLNGLTELGSVRAEMEKGKPHLKMFHSFVLPLKPEYRDYLADCERARREQRPLPPYDRRRYEYEINPQALAVTGTEIIRDRKDGPITGLKVKGKPVKAVPAYEVMPDFLAFTRHGLREVYYNAPYDMPFLGQQQEDIQAHDLARANHHRSLAAQLPHLPLDLAEELREIITLDYATATPGQRRSIVELMRPFTNVHERYRNPALWQCAYYGHLLAHGADQPSTLDDAYRTLDPTFKGRQEHTTLEDVLMAARVGLSQLPDDASTLPNIAELYAQLVHRFDPGAEVSVMEPREHGRQKGVEVLGDLQIDFSGDPRRLGDKAQRFWEFLEAFQRAPEIESRVPRHVPRLDARQHRAVISAERKNPLSLSFLKKAIFFSQVVDSPVFRSVLPFDSTGTRMDVVLNQTDASGQPIRIRNVRYGTLRANFQYLNAHPAEAPALLRMLSELGQADPRVGILLLQDRPDGSLDIRVKGHLRAFGECVLNLPAGTPLEQAASSMRRELELQLKLGAIPYVTGFGPMEEEEEERDNEALDLQEEENWRAAEKTEVSMRRDQAKRMELTVSAPVFSCLAFGLRKEPKELARHGMQTLHGPIRVQQVAGDAKNAAPRYRLTGSAEAFTDFVALGSPTAATERGESPSNLVRDASWLLWRLGNLPGTYGIHMEGHMAVLEQRDGTSLEALSLLRKLGVHFQMHDDRIRIDIAQLMENAFRHSVTLSRVQAERMEELRAGAIDYAPNAPTGDHRDMHAALMEGGKFRELEASENERIWGRDFKSRKGQPPLAHELPKRPEGLRLHFKNGQLQPEKSDVAGPHGFELYADGNGYFDIVAKESPVLLDLTARLAAKRRDLRINASDPSHWEVQGGTEAQWQQMLGKASRFLYDISKSTGSERVMVEKIEPAPNGKIRISLPQMSFLGRSRMLQETLQLHQQLGDHSMDGAINRLNRNLPDPTRRDPRDGQLLELSEQIRAEQNDVALLLKSLDHYLWLVRGSHSNLTKELKRETQTLGLLLHELSSTSGALKNITDQAAQGEVRTAQRVVGKVAYSDLEEHLAQAQKMLQGKDRTRGLLHEHGRAMAALMETYATEMATYDPQADLTKLMAPYREETARLLCHPEPATMLELEPYAAKAAFRSLRAMALSGEPVPLPVLHYLLAQAYPAMGDAQRDALVALYQTQGSAEARDAIHREFPESPLAPLNAEQLLLQYRLLTEAPLQTLPKEEWIDHRPEIAASIEKDIAEAYRKRGRHYANVAYMDRGFEPSGGRGGFEQNRRIAIQCFERAGMREEEIAKELRQRESKEFSAKQKASARGKVMQTLGDDEQKLERLRENIEQPEVEERLFERLLERAYRKEQKQHRELTEDIANPYHEFQHAKRLLAAVKKVRKENHDLLMVKIHDLREMKGLIMLLQQDEEMRRRVEDPALQDRIGQIGEAISNHPEVVGLNAQTLPTIRRLVEAQQDYLRGEVVGRLAENGVEPEFLPDGSIEVSADAFGRMFDAWCQNKTKKDIPVHLYDWIDRVESRLFREVPWLRKMVRDKEFAGVTATVELPRSPAEREAAWAQLEFAATGLGLKLPPMPAEGGAQEIKLPFLREVVRQKMAMDRPATAEDLSRAYRSFGRIQQAGATHVQRLGNRRQVAERMKRTDEEALQKTAEAMGIAPDYLCGLIQQAVEKSAAPQR